MEIRWLPRKSRRKTQPASPRGWKYSALIGARVPQSRAHIWRLGPDNRELERVVDSDGKPMVLHSHDKLATLAESIWSPGFYRIVLRTREGQICGRRDFQAAWRFSDKWDPATAREGYEPRSVTERLAAERDALKAKLKAAEARSTALEAERDALGTRVFEIEKNAEIYVAAVRENARERIAEAEQQRDALERLLADRNAELRRVRALYVDLAGGRRDEDEYETPDDYEADEPHEVDEPNQAPRVRYVQPPQRATRPWRMPKPDELEKIADIAVRIGERLGLVEPEVAEDDDDDEDDEV